MPARLVHALLIPVAAAVAVLLAPAPSASAAFTVKALGQGTLNIYAGASGFTVCGDGSVVTGSRLTGAWTLTGVISSGAVPGVSTSTAASFSDCFYLDMRGVPTGELVVDLSYAGVGTGVFVHSFGGATWAPGAPPLVYTVDLTPYTPPVP